MVDENFCRKSTKIADFFKREICVLTPFHVSKVNEMKSHTYEFLFFRLHFILSEVTTIVKEAKRFDLESLQLLNIS